MKYIFSKYFIYLIFIFSFLSLFLFVTNFFGQTDPKFRSLSDDGLEKICKGNEDIYNYYYKSADYNVIDQDFGKMNDASQLILDFITDDFNFEYIFDYIGKTKVYIFFLILLIIIIILTIYYSLASCVRCCTEKCCDFFSFSFCKNAKFKKCVCICIPFIYLLVFIFAILAIIFAVAAVQRFSGTVCVAIQLVDTFVEGEIRNVIPKWTGVLIVSEILEKLSNITKLNYTKTVNNINTNMEKYFDKLNEWNERLEKSHIENTGKNFTIKSPKMFLNEEEKDVKLSPIHSYFWGPQNKTGTILFDIDAFDAKNTEKINFVNYILENYLYSFLGCSKKDNQMICEASAFSEKLFSGAEIIRKIKEPLSDVKTMIAEPIQNVYYQINTTVIGIFTVIIIFVIIYCILIEGLLGLFCCSKNNKCLGCCLKWILCFIYYTSIFIIIIGFIIGIVVGVIGSLAKDMAQVLVYITSQENLISDNPKIFGKNAYIKYLDVCLNGDGNLAKALNLIDSFDTIDNITDISDDTEQLINETNTTSPMINYYIDYLNNLTDLYLETQYYDVGEKNAKIFNITERIEEINNYVSGAYSQNKQDTTCLINETWTTKTTKDGYIYNNVYPDPDTNSRYLIYLYDKGLYDKVNFDKRYDNACPISEHPYENVSIASSKFSKLFMMIKDNMTNNMIKDYIKDLNELNKIFNEKNKYLVDSLKDIVGPIDNIVNSIIGYVSGKDNVNVFSLLNCKFVGENKKILLDILYTSLGVFLEYFGIMTILLSIFLFIGIIFILIIIKNTELEGKGNRNNNYLENLNDIWKGNDLNEQYLISNMPTQELIAIK